MNRLCHRSVVRLALFVAPLALAACAGSSSDHGRGMFGLGSLTGSDEGRSISYRCNDDRRLRVTLNEDRDRATVEAGDRTYRLRLRDREGDERRYGEDNVQLTVGDGRAYLRVAGGRDYADCREI
ncbi:hypothetical protein [Benzoatithermus flavus]|uniref:C-type lysozyme inhibitor domain-containing protein n=1 Tax=Benzoatithermus flavus TaxID=3108223 RepID=A0ABU8XQR3_9PROT